MHLFERVVLAIRNPGGHSFPEGPEQHAVEYVSLISLRHIESKNQNGLNPIGPLILVKVAALNRGSTTRLSSVRIFTIFHPGVFTIIDPPPQFCLLGFYQFSFLHDNHHQNAVR
jgi:hypothetical protein